MEIIITNMINVIILVHIIYFQFRLFLLSEKKNK